MATIQIRSLKTITSIVFSVSLSCSIFTSCTSTDGQGNPGETICIPVPKDTSSLAKIDHYIPKGDIDKFRASFDVQKDTLARRVPNLSFSYSEAFNKRQLLELLKDTACVGLRIYYGVKTAGGGKENQLRMMIVGVNSQGQDLYWKRGTAAAAQVGNPGDGGGLEYGQCNPPCNPGDDGHP
jgi:hypothetical protein